MNEAADVLVRVMPFVALPLGSVLASSNSIRASAARPAKAAGSDPTSALVMRKSLLRTAIWLSICASEMFCAAVLKTTWTTVGITVIPLRAATPPAASTSHALVSLRARACR